MRVDGAFLPRRNHNKVYKQTNAHKHTKTLFVADIIRNEEKKISITHAIHNALKKTIQIAIKYITDVN